jgi:CubicO group peptidase (beta-lactamase class C family)
LSAPDALVSELRRELRTLQEESPAPSVNGALFRGGEILWSEAVGLADVEAGREATPETQYAIASITKTFVAAAVMSLRDEGRLALDDPVGRYLEEVDRPGVTIRRMLAHLSGLQREAPGRAWETLEMPSLDELLRSVPDAEQVLDAGAEWHYSNLAYGLLGEVARRLSGRPVEELVEERLLQPLGLAQTTWQPGPHAAAGYFVERFADVAHRSPVLEKRALAAAGALWSTTGDLARWGAFLVDPDDDILARATVDEMHSVQVMADRERWQLGWGLGLMLHRRGDRLFAGHDGGTVGHSSHLSYSRDAKVGVVFLANTENPSPTFDPVSLNAKAADALPAEREPWLPGEPAPPELAGVLGTWWGEGIDWLFEWRRGQLEAARPGRGRTVRAVFEREGEDVYRTASGRERGELLEIVRDESGEPVKLYWATYPFTRTPQPFTHTPQPPSGR